MPFSSAARRTRLLRGAEHSGDVIAALEKSRENGFAEILLADDRDAHRATLARRRRAMQ
jgi:hypothetical protein